MASKPTAAMQKPNNKKTKKKKRGRKIARRLLYTFLTFCTIGLLTSVIVSAYVVQNVVSYVNQESSVIDLDYEKSKQSQTSFIYAYDKNKKPVELARLHGTENRVWVEFANIPENLRNAAIAIEDKRFQEHHGVDWIRTISAFTKYSFSQGGSTITQQLIKNLTNEKDVTLVRKFNEIRIALNLEKHYNKDTILEAYLNTLYLGNGCYGVRTAAETYFGKDITKLNLAECATLVVITQKPSAYDPFRNPKDNKERQERCLGYMLEQGFISQEEHDKAVAYKLVFTNSSNYKPDPSKKISSVKDNDKINSFYVDFVIESVIKDLMEEYGWTKTMATDKMYYGGLRIYAAVDLGIQAKLDDVYVNRKSSLYASVDTAKNPAVQSGMTIMDYQGRVVAIVGKAGKKTLNRSLNRALSYRQPGSTIKPLSTYAPAIELGQIKWNSYEKNYALFALPNGKLFPQNVDGTPGTGAMVSMPQAIQKSYNTVPARIIQKMGRQESFDFLRDKFHFENLDERRDVDYSPLATGSLTNGTNTLEMAAAYAAFGNNGKYYKPYCYYQVLDGSKNDEVLLEGKSKPEQILRPATADIMQELLKTVDRTTHGVSTPSLNRFEVMAKTGTTNDKKDRWFCTGSPYYVSATWYGYDKPKTIETSYNPAARIALTVQESVHKDLELKKFKKSEESVQRKICSSSSLLAGKNCTATTTGWFDKDRLPGTCSRCTAAPPPTSAAAGGTQANPIQNAVSNAADAVSNAVEQGRQIIDALKPND